MSLSNSDSSLYLALYKLKNVLVRSIKDLNAKSSYIDSKALKMSVLGNGLKTTPFSFKTFSNFSKIEPSSNS